MPRAAVADFVDSFFTSTLFQADDSHANSVLSAQLAPDANIVINGSLLTSSAFIGLITSQFRATVLASITEIKDLNIVTTNDSGSTGIVGQWTAYVTKNKDDGKEIKQSATTIVRVEEREGKHFVTGLWEAQTVDES